MKKTITTILVIAVLALVAVAIAGVIKFNVIQDDIYIQQPDGTAVNINDISEYVITASDGTSGVLTYTSPETVTLQIEGVSHQLQQVISGSGARYANADESVVYWEHQGEATIEINGEEAFAINKIQEADIIGFNIAAQKSDCVGVGPMQCLTVNGELFYSDIKGFDYVEGFEYEIIVARSNVENPPADASAFEYTLIEIISTTEMNQNKNTTENNTATQATSESDVIQTLEVSGDSKNLMGTSWVYGDSGKISFNDGRYSATAGCNTLNGVFTENNNTISFEPGISTLMACIDLGEAEENLKQILDKANTYTIVGEKLTLIAGDVSLELSPLTATKLIGTQWNIFSLKEGMGITSDIVDAETFLLLNNDGTFSGKSACNSVMGGYALDGKNISFSNIGSTKMLCAETQNTREQLLIESLSNISEYTIDGSTLTLRSPEAAYQIELSSK